MCAGEGGGVGGFACGLQVRRGVGGLKQGQGKDVVSSVVSRFTTHEECGGEGGTRRVGVRVFCYFARGAKASTPVVTTKGRRRVFLFFLFFPASRQFISTSTQ